jgi:hypothetical protein
MPDKVYFWVFFRACPKFNHLKPKIFKLDCKFNLDVLDSWNTGKLKAIFFSNVPSIHFPKVSNKLFFF